MASFCRGILSREARRRRRWWSTGWEGWSWRCWSVSSGSRCSSCPSLSLWLVSLTRRWMFRLQSPWLAFRCGHTFFYQIIWAKTSLPSALPRNDERPKRNNERPKMCSAQSQILSKWNEMESCLLWVEFKYISDSFYGKAFIWMSWDGTVSGERKPEDCTHIF